MKDDVIHKPHVALTGSELSRQGKAMGRREFLKRVGCASAGLAAIG